MKKKKEKVFLLTGEQWLGVVILGLLIAGTMVGIKWLQPEEKPIVIVEDSAKIQFENKQAKQDSIYKAKWKKTHKKDTIEIRMQMFDPNTVDSITLLHLGLKPWQAKNLLKYRAKGGKYRKNEDLKRLYGMTDSMYNALSPYIYIARDTTITDTIAADSARIDSLPKWKSQKKDTILNLRTADTTELKMIKGIGSYRAKQIVKYREQLGGFVRVEQIMEAKGMEKAVADSILPHFFLDSIIIKPLMVNKIRPENLSKHPYINFEKAKAIYEYRRRHIRIRSKEELQKIDALNAEDIKKIEIYLDFSD
jgi:competence ComEA-like helix-hairpin-helix protein